MGIYDRYSAVITMRSYIFTEHERKILKEWLTTGTELQGIKMILSRIRLFKKLKEDVKMFKEAEKRLNK
jgi:hypothetical protein